MLFFANTHELVYLEGGAVIRAWMDKSQRRELAKLPSNATGARVGSKAGGELEFDHGYSDKLCTYRCMCEVKMVLLPGCSRS